MPESFNAGEKSATACHLPITSSLAVFGFGALEVEAADEVGFGETAGFEVAAGLDVVWGFDETEGLDEDSGFKEPSLLTVSVFELASDSVLAVSEDASEMVPTDDEPGLSVLPCKS
ncbi:MAG: hypothetical protein E7539_06135 [Ruminococcaceae bacterium]|nr:hypothetical protein [Oscillospiraceae bacterium]